MFKQIFLSPPTHLQENWIYKYVEQEVLYQKCKFHVPMVRGFDSRARLKWSYSVNALNVKKSSLLLLHVILNINWLHINKDNKALY